MSLYERTLKRVRDEKRPTCRQGIMTNGTLSGDFDPSVNKNVPFVTCASEVETRLRFFAHNDGYSTNSLSRASDNRDTFPKSGGKTPSDTAKMSQLSTTPVDKRDTFESLPDKCPFNTGGPCPPGCRFETRFLVRMIKQGAPCVRIDVACP